MHRGPAFRRLACLLLIGLWGGLTQAGPVSLRDDRGVPHTWPTSPRRIVSLLPSLTESVCALGGCSRLVGVDRFSNTPPEVLALPKLGGLDDAQVERIASLKPDVVLAGPSARVIDRLEALGLKVVILDAQTHAEVKRTLVNVAAMLGTPVEATRAWSRIEQQLHDAAARVPVAVRGQTVYFEIDATPYAAGSSSFIGETLRRLHMGNVVAPSLGRFPRLNPEFVVQARPDIIMAGQRSLDEMPRRPGWASLTALQRRRSCGFDLAQYDVLVRAGPRMGEGALQLADCLASLAAEAR